MRRVHESLQHVFLRNRLVFWYDPEGQWSKAFDSFPEEGIKKVRVEGTEFGTKVAIHRDPDPQARYLLYFPGVRPKDSENWLLDLLLQGHEFKADRASLALQEMGLPYDFRGLVMDHVEFYEAPKRIQALRELLTPDEHAMSLRLKMMTVLAKAEPDIDSLLLSFLAKDSPDSLLDPVEACLGQYKLGTAFWKEIAVVFRYTNEKPTLRDFVTTLFRWANPLDSGISLDPHAKVFLQRWKDSQAHCSSFRAWATLLEADLHVAEKLDSLDGSRGIETADTFPIFEKFVIHRLCRAFEKGESAPTLLAIIQDRRHSCWYAEHRDGYDAIEQAIAFRQQLEAAELKVESIEAGVSRYLSTWYRIDTAYRRFHFHLRRYGQVALMEKVAEWIEKSYVNNFLLPLTDRWSDQVRGMKSWNGEQLQPQTAF